MEHESHPDVVAGDAGHRRGRGYSSPARGGFQLVSNHAHSHLRPLHRPRIYHYARCHFSPSSVLDDPPASLRISGCSGKAERNAQELAHFWKRRVLFLFRIESGTRRSPRASHRPSADSRSALPNPDNRSLPGGSGGVCPGCRLNRVEAKPRTTRNILPPASSWRLSVEAGALEPPAHTKKGDPERIAFSCKWWWESDSNQRRGNPGRFTVCTL